MQSLLACMLKIVRLGAVAQSLIGSASAQSCPQPFVGFHAKWIWTPIYFVNNSSLDAAAISSGVASWNNVQGYIQIQPSGPPLGYQDIIIEDATLGPEVFGEALLYSQTHGPCSSLKDQCGRCMDSTVMFQAVIKLNRQQILFYIGGSLDLAGRTRAVVAHEIGHVLRLAHVSHTQICTQISSIMIPSAQPLFLCGKDTPTQSCDGGGVALAFGADYPGTYCPCWGIPCQY